MYFLVLSLVNEIMSAHAILVQYQPQLAVALEGIEFLRLCSTLARYRVTDAGLREKLQSLDRGNLEFGVAVRFLLQQVCDGVKNDNKVFTKLIKAFKKLSMTKLCDEMVSKFNAGKEPETLEADLLLTEQDVPYLVEILTPGSHLWNAIGIALKLPKHKREDCGEGRESVIKLTNILTAWVEGCYEGATCATLDKLRNALGSQIVDLGKLAQKLGSFEKCERRSPKLARLSSKPEIEYQSSNTKVSEGKSTLLEVCVEAEGESIYYQWEKNNQRLDNANYSGVDTNMLYINNATEDLEGKYTCIISVGCESIVSEEIELKVVYPSEKQYLMSLYSVVGKEVPLDSWPPVSILTFINLVLVRQSPISSESYFTVCGDMDDILESKEVVEYGEIFKEYKKGALVLLEGRPGSGKTTLVHKITNDWAHERNILQGAKMVFLLTLRLLNFSANKPESLAEILKVFYSSPDMQREIQNKLENCEGENACFVLDGLDEYKPHDKKKSVIYQLIEKRILPFAMVIVASRPVATNDLKGLNSRRIEVIGFSKEQIYKYVEAYPFEKENNEMLAQKLKEYLSLHPNVVHMCYLPVHAAMICFLFGDLKEKMPSTEAKIYEKFTISSILRQRRRETENVQLIDLKSLSPDYKAYVDNICKLAYDMTFNSQQVVSKTKAHVSLSHDDQLDWAAFGLLTVERTSKSYGIEDVYSFLHLTLQEFLAAFHLAQQDEAEQCTIFEDHINSTRMKKVWKFFFGLCENKVLLKKVLLENISNSVLYGIQCVFESQDFEVFDSIIGDRGTVEFVGDYFTPNDFVALACVTSKGSKIKKISFKDCYLTFDGVSAFASKIDQGCSCRSLEFKYSHPKEDTLKMINVLLCQFPCLEELTLSLDGLKEAGVKCLTDNICLRFLKVLKIMRPVTYFADPQIVWEKLKFGSISLEKIEYCVLSPYSSSSEGLCESKHTSKTWVCHYNLLTGTSISQDMFTSCTEIILINCGIGNEEANVIAKSPRLSSILKYLILDFNKISDPGAVALADCLARCTTLLEFSVECNSIGDSGAKALANSLVHCSNLKKINLQGNCFGDEGVLEFATRWHIFRKSALYLCNKNVTEKGVKKVMSHSNRIQIQQIVFDSSWNVITSAGAAAFKSGLECGNLHELLLSDEDTVSSFVQFIDTMTNRISGVSCTLSDATITDVCRILTSFDSMKRLQFSNMCEIPSKKVQLLVDLFHNKKLTSNIEAISMTDIEQQREPVHPSIISAIKSCEKIQALCLRGCKLSDENLHSLFISCSWSSLTDLDLSHNKITFEGARILKKVLKQVCVLKLSHNRIEDKGAIYLAEGFSGTTCLQELDLSNNNIHLKGIEKLSAAIVECKNLQVLNFGANKLGSDGVGKLSAVLSKVNIRHLDLSSCGISIEGVSILKSSMSCNALSTLAISGNTLGSAGVACVGDMLSYCRNLLEIDISNNGFGSHANYRRVEAQHVETNSEYDDGYNNEFPIDLGSETHSNEDWRDQNDDYLDGEDAIGCDDTNDFHESDDYMRGNTSDDYLDGEDADFRESDDYMRSNSERSDYFDYNSDHESRSDSDIDLYGNPRNNTNYSDDDMELPDETSKQAIITLAKGLRECRNLQKLSLSSNNLNPQDIQLLVEKLKHCEILENLNLDDNIVESNGARNIMKNCKNLSKLSLQNSHMDLGSLATIVTETDKHAMLEVFVSGSKIDEHEERLLEGESCHVICEEFLRSYNLNGYVTVFINGHAVPKR